MVQAGKRYPLGVQTFENIIKGNYLYVDKTAYVYKMAHASAKYVFLSRPRRFGKSLFVTTLRSYFEGRKDLFKDLAIEKMEHEWVQYPVIHLDMSATKRKQEFALNEYLLYILKENAERLGVALTETSANLGLMQLVKGTKAKYGHDVVVLLDEYDAPLLNVLHDDVKLDAFRDILRDFFAPLKKSENDIHFVFITGITKFSQVSIFSELNNLTNISMNEEYAGICGITEEEMLSQLDEGISELSGKMGVTKADVIAALKDNYDGYHFTWPSADIYNPFSLLSCLSEKKIKAYWFSSGTPTFLIEMLRKHHVSPSQLNSPRMAMEEDFDAPTEKMTRITPLLYQSGYITIKDCNMFGKYTLDIPNKEIRLGLMKSLLPYYLGPNDENGGAMVASMQEALYNDDINAMFEALQTFLKTVPKVNIVEKPEHFEAHWQQMLFIVFSMMGAYCDVEVKTGDGSVDLVARTNRALYLIELKVNQTALVAMNQIDLKNYDAHFALSKLPVVRVGVNFSEKERNITKWVVG